MKPLGYSIALSLILFTAGCAGEVPAPPSTPEPSPTHTPFPTSTPQPQGLVIPQILLSLDNDPDRMKDPYGIALDSSGNIYVSDAGNSRVLIFDKSGKLLAKWDKRSSPGDKQGSGEGEFKSLGFGGIAIDGQDHVFVVDNGNHRIQKFDREGNFLLQWGEEGRGDGQFIRAIGIATDKDGNVYVTDDDNPYVQKFDKDGQFLMKWGGAGKGDGEFSHATGIAVDAQGNVFVADYENKRVQKFNDTGEFISQWTLGSDVKIAGTPEGIFVNEQGQVYVTDYQLGRVEVFTNDGEFLQAWGNKGLSDPLFKRPTGIVIDDGRVYVVNQAGNNVQIFNLP